MSEIRRGTPQYTAERNLRLKKLELLRQQFPTRLSFINSVMNYLYKCDATPMQQDMIEYMDAQTDHYMVQMPRGEGKTVITAINSIYELILDPTSRIAIFSGNDDVASEISGFIYKLFHDLPFLDFMLPDRRLKDKSSMENFSVCGYLKGTDKSPSVRCRPIFGGFQGIRADIIIGDDIEMMKNSATAPQREKLRAAIQELESLLDRSKPRQLIQLLGTPQSTDSTYNVLPSLEFNVRIWPARVPTEEDIDFYGDMLAPYVRAMYDADPANRTGCGMNGDRGIPTDPYRYGEPELIRKEQTQHLGGMFDLQFMLCTKMADKDRYPLKIDKLLFMDLPETQAPLHINTIRSMEKLIKAPAGFSVPQSNLYEVMGHSSELADYETIVIYIDPSGGGSTSRDEVAYAVVKSLNGNVMVDRINGLQGGYKHENLEHLADIIGYYWSLDAPLVVYCEDNYGNGMFRSMLQSVVHNKYIGVEIEGDHVTGQKELRIIDTISPLLNSNKLIFNKEVLTQDVAACTFYDARERSSYSLFHQMQYITRERQSLKHDDRLDALAGALKFFSDLLVVDQQGRMEQMERDAKIDAYRRMFPNRADEILENLGLIKNTKYSGMNHTNFGKYRKSRNNGKYQDKDFLEEHKYKSPWEQQKAERTAAKVNEESGSKGRGHSDFYSRNRSKRK